MTIRIDVKPALLDWAISRSKITPDANPSIYENYLNWRSKTKTPTLKQLEKFAQASLTPIGWLLLDRVPEIALAIPDFRTQRNAKISSTSPNLLDAVNICIERQNWYRAYCHKNSFSKPELIASISLNEPPKEIAKRFRAYLNFEMSGRGEFRNFEEAYKYLIRRIEELGCLVMISGIVGNNTHRKLDPTEFRGFALADDYAPLIFINGSDSKAAQIFTLLHELGHLILGESGISDREDARKDSNEHELWCNEFAAEFLVPEEEVRNLQIDDYSNINLQEIGLHFKASSLVVVKQMHKAGSISWEQYAQLYDAEQKRIKAIFDLKKAGGGNFYRTQTSRLSKNFVIAVATDAREGKTPMREAFNLLGTSKLVTFNNLAEAAGAL